MQNTRRSASYSEKGPIKCRRNPFDLLFVLIMINIIHPKRRAGAFFFFLEMQDFPIWQRLLTFSALLVFQLLVSNIFVTKSFRWERAIVCTN